MKFETKCNIDGCNKEARWLAWYKGCGSLYTYLCTKHAHRHMRNKATLYPVICIRSIDDAINKNREEKTE
jgi:hypothetical protein